MTNRRDKVVHLVWFVPPVQGFGQRGHSARELVRETSSKITYRRHARGNPSILEGFHPLMTELRQSLSRSKNKFFALA